MPNRVLRVTVDIVWPEGSPMSVSDRELQEIVNAAKGGVRAGLSEELLAQHVAVQAANNARNTVQGVHSHNGRSGCLVCADLYQDKKGN